MFQGGSVPHQHDGRVSELNAEFGEGRRGMFGVKVDQRALSMK